MRTILASYKRGRCVAAISNTRLIAEGQTEVEDDVLLRLGDDEANEGVQEAIALAADETCPF